MGIKIYKDGDQIADIEALGRHIATEAEAVAGTVNNRAMTPLRTKQAIEALGGGGGGSYSYTTVPDPATRIGQTIYVTDGADGSPCGALSDGVAWKRLPLGVTIAPSAGVPSLDASNPINANIELCLLMDEGLGDVLTDISGFGRDMTFASSPTRSVDGVEGKIVRIQSGNYAQAAGDVGDISGDISFVARLNLDAWGGYNTWLEKGNHATNDSNYTFGTNISGYTKFGYNNGSFVDVLTAPLAFGGAWVTAAITVDKAGGTVSYYANGILVDSKVNALTYVTNSGPLRLGANGNGGEAMTGYMKWLRLYSRKLSDAEVLALHNDYLSGVIYS